eukprot:TRINITY_DN13067_c1_g1_i2.p1 TRINITY_DN13067_c1_g1~~TRINITY_DN13067_c1_g1_i2.p1  ORF type:complete len:686 (-),score=49.46 TRINITY_DN13067_c1_g1_i2:216-2273(-)
MTESETGYCFFIWEWEEVEGVWHTYPPAHTLELARKHREYVDHHISEKSASSSRTTPPFTTVFSVGDVHYLIDVSKMLQTRVDTGTARRLRRTRIAGGWSFLTTSTEKMEIPVMADPHVCAVIEFHRREASAARVFEQLVSRSSVGLPRTSSRSSSKGAVGLVLVRFDLNTNTWELQEDVVESRTKLSGQLERSLPVPTRLPKKSLRPVLWVPNLFFNTSTTVGNSAIIQLPPFPLNSGKGNWRSLPPGKNWERRAPAPALGVLWGDENLTGWSTMYCLGYGCHAYQAEAMSTMRQDVISGAVHVRSAESKRMRSHQEEEISPCDASVSSSGSISSCCRVCHESVETTETVQCTKCNFHYCSDCFNQWLKPKGERAAVQCPQCKQLVANTRGSQPSGWLEWWVFPPRFLPVPTFEDHPTILINYDFPDGEQLHCHGNPGAPFRGDQRVGFFPYLPETAALLRLFVRCFEAGRMFTVSESVTTGEQNTLVWGGVHHKTTLDFGAVFGYPDLEYFTRVGDELRRHGIHPTDTEARVLGKATNEQDSCFIDYFLDLEDKTDHHHHDQARTPKNNISNNASTRSSLESTCSSSTFSAIVGGDTVKSKPLRCLEMRTNDRRTTAERRWRGAPTPTTTTTTTTTSRWKGTLLTSPSSLFSIPLSASTNSWPLSRRTPPKTEVTTTTTNHKN